jgi:hypothetical protein
MDRKEAVCMCLAFMIVGPVAISLGVTVVVAAMLRLGGCL